MIPDGSRNVKFIDGNNFHTICMHISCQIEFIVFGPARIMVFIGFN